MINKAILSLKNIYNKVLYQGIKGEQQLLLLGKLLSEKVKSKINRYIP